MPKPLPVPVVKSDHTVFAVFEEDIAALMLALRPATAAYLGARGFAGKAGTLAVIPGDASPKSDGAGMTAWFGLGARKGYNPLTFRALPGQLPKGRWALKVEKGLDLHAIHVAWGLGLYSFGRYKSSDQTSDKMKDKDKGGKPEVTLDDGAFKPEQKSAIALEIRVHALARDLVNTPANDMGPQEIEDAARAIAVANAAEISVISGEDLLAQNYPAVHAVGRAADATRQPRFIEMTWTPAGILTPLPVVVLIGKGVAFDTGGLNIKGGAGMGLMKKDMGGAAHVLALAEWIMASGLAIKLHVLIPAVENSISGGAMRPGDVLASRAGLSIDLGNTDAEGRLILADALTRAGELSPDLTLDFATLTGAARVALGPEVIPFYCDDEDICRRLEVAAIAQSDPLWRMPLWAGYKDALDSDIADVRNDPAAWAQAGSVTAALFLQRFAPKTGAWVHFDIYAWNPRGRAGFPVGAEAQTLRAVYHLLKDM